MIGFVGIAAAALSNQSSASGSSGLCFVPGPGRCRAAAKLSVTSAKFNLQSGAKVAAFLLLFTIALLFTLHNHTAQQFGHYCLLFRGEKKLDFGHNLDNFMSCTV